MARLIRSRTAWSIAIACVAGIGGIGWTIRGEVPQWRLAGTRSVAMQPVGHIAEAALCPPDGGWLELRGDSHVAGPPKARGGSLRPYGAVLQEAIGPGIGVAMLGQGGITAQAAAARVGAGLARTPRSQGVVLLAYGTNDAAIRGWLRSRQAVPLARFRASLRLLIDEARSRGARVALIAPPPPGSQAMAERLAPYRHAVRAVAQEQGVTVFDPALAFDRCADAQPLLSHDALHLNARGHACLGRWLARELCGGGAPD